jgi:hypothetical protein
MFRSPFDHARHQETAAMTDYVNRRFHNYITAIQSLMETDADFREACANYEEICTWLAGHPSTAGQSSKEYDDAKELSRDLENEIHTLLEEHHVTTR